MQEGEWLDKEPQKRLSLWGRSSLSSSAQPEKRMWEGGNPPSRAGRAVAPPQEHTRAHTKTHTQKPWGLCSNLLGCQALLRGLSLPTCKTSSLPQAEQKGEKVESQNPGLTVTWQDLGKLRPDPD